MAYRNPSDAEDTAAVGVRPEGRAFPTAAAPSTHLGLDVADRENANGPCWHVDRSVQFLHRDHVACARRKAL